MKIVAAGDFDVVLISLPVGDRWQIVDRLQARTIAWAANEDDAHLFVAGLVEGGLAAAFENIAESVTMAPLYSQSGGL